MIGLTVGGLPSGVDMTRVEPKVVMRGIAKRFGDLVALREVDFAVTGGEICGLLGQNGAGKTTLMNILSGMYRADAGEVFVEGGRVSIASPADALRHGIGMVHQHFDLIPNFTALENVLLGREGPGWWLRLGQHRGEVEALARRFGLAISLDAKVKTLVVGVRQRIEILKALYRGVEILILDEPTALLTPHEVDALFGTIRGLAEGGVTVIFITHKIKEVLANCHRVTVMREGQVVGTLGRGEASEARLVEMMVGGPVDTSEGTLPEPRHAEPDGRIVLETRDVTITEERGSVVVQDVNLRVRAGELVGIAGVAGNGQEELAEALVGLLPVAKGSIRLGERNVTTESVRARIAAGLVFVPEDRIADGILPELSIAENLMLGLHRYVFTNRVTYAPHVARAMAREAIAEYGIIARDETAETVALSGGNIQKLLVARALTLAGLAGGRVVLAMNPTRGLDVLATGFVRRQLVEFTRSGGGVLLVSEDLDELMEICQRLLVIFRGGIVADLPRAAFDRYRIGHLMAGTSRAGV